MKRTLLLFAFALIGCSQGSEEQEPADLVIQATVAPIDPGVYQPYRRDGGYQKTFAKWGDKGVARIQTLREGAAETAARNPSCDAVELAELSDMKSAAPNNPVVFVDCRNSERFYFSEADVGQMVATQKQLGARWSSSDLIERCTSEVRNKLNLPASFDRQFFSTSDYQGASGNRVVSFKFTAQNYLGARLPASARCVMTPSGNFEVEIAEGQ